ncbi:MAG: tyrosine--tRNA ligase [Phycisphaerae bacterium]|nr:tyrosine--tRNA ligase [Phycisphaerae bacterium]
MGFPSVDEQMAVLERGCEHIYTEAELRKKLEESRAQGRPLRIKLGLDPTAPDIHLGHTVVLGKMRQFQDLGHKAVLIIGDYTAMVGDPSGKSKTRPMLSRQEIEVNARTYFAQAGKILDMSEDKLEIRPNSEWLNGLNLADALRLAGKMTVARMLERDSFEKRYKAGDAIYIHEFLYPLLQGYDSVAIESDVELGGTDQTFNNLVGRDLQTDAGQPPQVVMIMPILVGIDGVEKMSKSLGNYIGVTEPASEMFGKTMRIPDELMRNYYELLTTCSMSEISTLCDPSKTHPREAKVSLAKEIVARFHDAAAADREAELFDRVFRDGGLRDDIPEVTLSTGEVGGNGIMIGKMLKLLDLADSVSDGKRLVQQGGVSIDNEKLSDPQATITPADGMIVRVGKRRVAKVKLT